jgi:hypothetical protein
MLDGDGSHHSDRRDVLRLFAGVAALPFVPRLARGGAAAAWATGGTAP